MNIFRHVFIASAKELIRDRGAIFWFLVFPLIFIFIFGMVFSNTGSQVYNLGIIVKSDNQMTEGLVEGISSIDSFRVSVEKQNGERELQALRQGNRNLVMEIPAVSYQEIMAGKTIDIPLYYDAGRNQTSQVLISVINQVLAEAERRITGAPRVFNVKPQAIQANRLSDFDYILPGILGMALMQLGLFGSLQFLNLREKKIIRGLGVTPLSRGTLLGSEILLRMIMALIQTVLIIFIGQTVFNVTIISSLLKVFVFVILGSITFISLGYMLITFVKSSEAGNGLIQVIQFPMMFLSGTFFPVEMMPDYIRPVVKIFPLTFLGDALRQVMTGANTMGFSLVTDILVLCGWLVVTLVLAVKFWRWD